MSTPLGCATVGGREGVVRLLLDRKDVDPNRLDENDRTPLGYAALGGYEGAVGLLLYRKDVSPNRPAKNDQTHGQGTPKEHKGAAKLLLEREMSTLII